VRDLRFRNVRTRSGFQSGGKYLRRIVLAKDQDSTARKFAANQLGGLKTVDIGHADIHQDDVGEQLFCLFESIKTIDRFATYFQFSVRFQYRTKTPPKYLVVVRQQNAWSFGFHTVHTLPRKYKKSNQIPKHERFGADIFIHESRFMAYRKHLTSAGKNP